VTGWRPRANERVTYPRARAPPRTPSREGPRHRANWPAPPTFRRPASLVPFVVGPRNLPPAGNYSGYVPIGSNRTDSPAQPGLVTTLADRYPRISAQATPRENDFLASNVPRDPDPDERVSSREYPARSIPQKPPPGPPLKGSTLRRAIVQTQRWRTFSIFPNRAAVTLRRAVQPLDPQRRRVTVAPGGFLPSVFRPAPADLVVEGDPAKLRRFSAN